MTSLCPDVDIDLKHPTIRSLCWSWILAPSAYPLLRCWNWPYKIIFVLNTCPDVYCDRKILHLGVGAQMLTSIVNFSYIQGSYIQGFLRSGVLQSEVPTIRGLTIRGSYNQGSYNQGFLQLGVYISVSYMTHLCPAIDIDRCSLHSGFKWTCLTWQVCFFLSFNESPKY